MFFNYKKHRTYIGFSISIVLICLFIKVVDFHTVLRHLTEFDLRFLFALILLYMYGVTVRIIRWRYLIKQDKTIPFSSVLRANAIGFMVNSLFPLRIGEVVKAEYVAIECSISRSFLLGTVFAERMLDSLILLAFLFVSALFSQTLLNLISTNMWALIAIMVIFVFVLICLLNNKPREILVRVFPIRHQIRLSGIAEKISEAVSFLKEWRLSSKMIVLTFSIWLGTLISCFIILFGVGIVLPFYAYMFIVSVGALGMVIPSSPGNMGVYHAASMGAVMLFMVDKETALTYAIISHAADFIPNVMFGLFVSIDRSLPLGSLYRRLTQGNPFEVKLSKSPEEVE